MPCLGCCSRARASLSTSSELHRISVNGRVPTDMTGSYTSGGISPTSLENRRGNKGANEVTRVNGGGATNEGENEYEYVSVVNEKRSSKEGEITPVHGASPKKDLQNSNAMKKPGSKTRMDNGAEDAIVLASEVPPLPRTPTTPVVFDVAPPPQPPRLNTPQPHSSEVSVQVEVHSCGSVSASAGTGSVTSSCDESLGAAPASSPSPHAPSPAPAPDAHHSEERMVAEPEYEDIYQLREEALGQPLPQSQLAIPNGSSSNTNSSGALRRDGDNEGMNGEGAVDGDGERQRRPSASHTLPPPLPPASAPNSRALKRVVSEPPPPPPPPPSGVDMRAPSPIPPHGTGDGAPMSLPAALPPSPAVTPEPVLRPSEVLRAQGAAAARSRPPGDAAGAAPEAELSQRLVNKQMVLPFVPPKFPSAAAHGDALIKPSEYLRSLGGAKPPPPASAADGALHLSHAPASAAAAAATVTLPASTPGLSVLADTRANRDTVPGAPAAPVATLVGPPPPPLPASPAAPATTQPPAPPAAPSASEAERQKQAAQPLGAISVEELSSVRLKPTEGANKALATKTMSAPPRTATGAAPTTNGEPFRAQKDDLIAELKMSKDISGIKKMKVERARDEQRQEKELMTEVTRAVTASTFVEQIPARDAAGNPVPEWKRQMLAKKAAERARREMEERLQREAEEKRLQAIPAWKRQLMAKKEEIKSTVYTPRVDDKRSSKGLATKEECWHQNPRSAEDGSGTELAVNGTNGTNGTNAPGAVEENNKENKTPVAEEDDQDTTPIIPWRAQLRKTNSKLSLME